MILIASTGVILAGFSLGIYATYIGYKLRTNRLM